MLSFLARGANAQTLTTLYSFSGPDGAYPLCGLTLSGSALYGATEDYIPGVGLGTVFSLPVTGGSLNWYTPFNPGTGWIPGCAPRLLLVGSNLYGTANGAGGGGIGTVFSVPVTGGNITVLGSFNQSSGGNPGAGVTLSADGSTLYGTTNLYSTYDDGAVYSVPIGGGSPTPLASINGTGNQDFIGGPVGPLIRVGSTLYGMTAGGGAYNDGSVFSIPVTGGSLTTICSFNGSDGANPQGAVLILSGSTFYGTTYSGGSNNDGTVFSLPITGGTATALCSFSGSNGSNPLAGLTLSSSSLFGTTYSGGANNDGTVFTLPITGGTPTVLHSFNGTDGLNPRGDLTLSANGSTLYGTTTGGGAANDGTVFALSIVPPASIALGNVLNATIISGGTATLAATVSNSAAVGASNLNYTMAAVQSGSATLGTVTAASGSIAPSGSQPCTVSATSTNLGANIVSFTATDPNAANSPQSATATLTVLGHAAPTLVVSNGNNQTVIIGATSVTAALSLSNGTQGQSGLAGLDVNSLGYGVTGSTGGALVASGSSLSYTAALSTGTLGTQAETFSLNVGDDHTLSGASAAMNVSATTSLTVIDHSNASLSASTNQTLRTLNFGNVLRGAIVPSQTFTLYNRAANTSPAFTANMKLTGFTTAGDPAFTTTIAPFGGLSPGGYVTFNASLNTSNYTTTGSGTASMAASQLVDDSTLLGAGNNNNGGIAVVLQGNVGNATANASNSQTAFGPALTAAVAQNGSYANLESTVKSTTGSGGNGAVGSTATILAGTNSSGPTETVSMAWRTTTTPAEGRLISDVVDFGGMSLSASGQTAPFVLQMSYNAGRFAGPIAEATAAANQMVMLDYLDPATDEWENAIDGDFGLNEGVFHDAPWQSGDMTLGDWGVNTANHTAWAVVNHNSEFAVVPEPSSLALLAAGAGALAICRLRRRRPQ